MTLKKCLLICFGTLFWFSSQAQIPVIPDDFRVNLPNQPPGTEASIIWFELEYKYPMLDLRGLEKLTGHQLPDSLVITPPELSPYQDMTVLVGVSGKQTSPTLMIWLAANYHTNRIILFTDQNQDRDFTNDGKPLKIMRGGETAKIQINNQQGTQLLDLVPPARVNESYRLRPIGDGWSLLVSLGIGSGALDYNYTDLSFNQPTTYSVRFVEKSLKAGISYQWNKIQIGTSMAMQNHFFYTSILAIKKGEPIRREIPDPNFPGRTTFVTEENAEKFTNKDVHAKTRLQGQLYVAYSIAFGNSISLQPVIGIGLINYLNPQYTRLTNRSDETYDLSPFLFYELGLRTSFTVGLQRTVHLAFVYSSEQWLPEQFLASTPHENLNTQLTVWRFNLGYRFKLF